MRDYINIDTISKLILALAFYNFYGLRQCLVVGQQSIISLFLLLLAMLVKDRWLLAGVLLGFGISKYSVGLPVFLFLCYRGEQNHRNRATCSISRNVIVDSAQVWFFS